MLEFNREQGANPLLAFESVREGLGLMFNSQLRKFIILPLLINALLYIGLFFLGYFYLDSLIVYFIPDWLQWLTWLIYPLFFISFGVLGFFSFTLVANLIASPFYGDLSAKTLQLINPNAEQVVQHSFIAVIKAEIIRIMYLLRYLVPLVLLLLIPVINLAAPLLWLVFTLWGISMEYFAYPLENEGVLFKEQRESLKTIRIGSFSFAGLILLGLMIPLLNIFVPPLAVISATIYRAKLKPQSH